MLGIIGGSGVYDLDGLDITQEKTVDTPFGAPSAPLKIGTYGGTEIAFLARHGTTHSLLPHEVNYRANIWALKAVGVTRIIGISAVGSLRHDYAPGDLSIADQYFDFVKGPREKSFFGGGIAAHVSTAEPTCPCLTSDLTKAAKKLDITLHTGLTYACVDGPRLGTKAESLFLKNAVNCDLVGMTNVPEAFLTREAQICYATISVVTDYDCWLDDPDQHVSVEQVISRYGESLEKAKKLLGGFLVNDKEGANDKGVPKDKKGDCSCRTSLQSAVLTPQNNLSEANKILFDMLKR